jgi:hypothetical protein
MPRPPSFVPPATRRGAWSSPDHESGGIAPKGAHALLVTRALAYVLAAVVMAGCGTSTTGAPIGDSSGGGGRAGAAGPGSGGTNAGGATSSAGSTGFAGLSGETGGAAGNGIGGSAGSGKSTGGGGMSGETGGSRSGAAGSNIGGSAGSGLGGSVGGGAAGSAAGGGGIGGSGGPATGDGPCDIFASGNTPCVAAHSTVRALYRSYAGSLYQVRRALDNTTKDISVLSPGGFANVSTQDAFCAGTSCTIAIIYDQSGRGNHLANAPAGERKMTPDNEANATALKLTISGHTVYGVHIPPSTGYRNNKTSGIAIGDQPETEYMVTSGTFYNNGCCFDYGNAETDNHADGSATMEAVYFGNNTQWGKGGGSGPWVMADLENGLYPGSTFTANQKDTSQTSIYVTAMVIGRSGSFALKGGDAQAASLATIYDGARPSGYNPMKKQGAIVLGIGGDNSPWGQGNFFEGAMTSGATSDATASSVQANIAAAGYGR